MQDSSIGTIEGLVDDVEFEYDTTEVVNSRGTALRIRHLAPQRDIYSRDVIAVLHDDGSLSRDGNLHRILYLGTKGEGYVLKQARVTSPPQRWLHDFLLPAIPAHLSISHGEERLPNIHVVVSSKSGLCKAKVFCDEIVRPVFAACGLKHEEDYVVHETETRCSVTEFARTVLLPLANQGQPQTVLLLSGDGAVVDIVNVLLSSSQTDAYVKPVIGLVAMGTGNALAHSTGLTKDDTMGFASFLRGTPHSLPTFTAKFSAGSEFVVDEGRRAEPLPQPEGSELGVVYGAVVCSWALHGALVANSDTFEYRKHGSDRFQMAAKELLFPSNGSEPHRFKGKITLIKKDQNGKEVRTPLDRQEHGYVLATLVSNLEQTLTISPLSRPLDCQLRLVHFAPLPGDEVMRIMGLAYQGGGHVKEDVVGYEEIDGLRIEFNEPNGRWRRLPPPLFTNRSAVPSTTGERSVAGSALNASLRYWKEDREIHSWSESLCPSESARMLISARTYRQSQDNGKDSNHSGLTFHQAASSRAHAEATRRAKKMLLLHQTGSVKIGEVIRYTLTYTPSLDRILPSPSALHIKIKNTSAIPLRAAYLHGPYTLYTACYPSTFDPNYKSDKPWEQDVPQFEPNLKAGGSWHAQLTVPERIRETAGKANVKRTTDGGIPSITWVIEISSQIIFSTSAAVHFELLVGRDRKSVDLGTQIAGIMGSSNDSPGKLQDHQEGKKHRDGRGAAQPKGVFSNAINVIVDDTTSLWNKPTLPEWDDVGRDRSKKREYPDPGEEDFFQYGAALGRKSMESLKPGGKPKAPKQRRNIHLVVLTHGLHSNLGADLLYLKESIDITARQAREDARKRKATQREGEQKCKSREARNADAQPTNNDTGPRSGPLEGGQEGMDNRETGGDEDEEEEVIVRGFTGNAVRTERGIQYLGKRLARYVLSMTYPDQPFLPIKKSAARKISRALTSSDPPDMHSGLPAHSHSSIHREYKNPDHLAYKISSISFIGHSLGGLVQMYAIAYIHKHSPHFFDEIKPINFITMASPLLGLSNENPIYVKFALDFGLVGRTGQDLGLTWRAPTMVRSGWGAMIGGIGTDAQRAHRHPDPGAKPLLRVLPTGPAHKVLKMFRNRTVYSNVVNDGIVPLRTSCLLFLDWRGLGRVEKARRENGLVGTMAGWGWAEITGANSSAHRQPRPAVDGGNSSQTGDSGDDRDGTNMPTRKGQGRTVPQPAENATEDDNETQGGKEHDAHTHSSSQAFEDEAYDAEKGKHSSAQQPVHPLAGLLSFLRPSSSKSHHHPHKHRQIYERSQTKAGDTADDGDDEGTSATNTSIPKKRPIATRGDSQIEDPENLFAPPKTTFFEAAGDVLKPPLPTEEFLVNPSSRPRTIFHDRVYHPHDIPPPPPKKAGASSPSNDSRNSIPRSSNATQAHNTTADTSGMKVEEKIARAYHKDLSWRKVLVRLEPDAHNNMIVRRMFSNAYGWPVIKHLCDTHFADTHAATTADTKESSEERAKPMAEGVGSHGEEVNNQSESPLDWRGDERREAKDQVPKLRTGHESSMSIAMGHRKRSETLDSADWDDRFFDPTDDDDDDDIDFPVAARPRSHSQHDGASPAIAREKDCRPSMSERSSQTELPGFLTSEPEEMENIEHAGQCNVAPERQVGDPVWASTSGTSALAGSTSGLGLRRSGGEQLDLPSRTRKIDVRYA